MLSLRTRVVESSAEMDCLAPLWNRLASLQPITIFQRYEWNRLAAKVFRDRMTPSVVAVESDAGAAIIPAAIRRHDRRLEMLGEEMFDYRDVLHVGDSEILRIAWHDLAKLSLPLSVTAVAAASAVRWQEFPVVPFARSPAVTCDAIGAPSFRAAHPRLAQQLRRMKKKGINLGICTGGDRELVRRLYVSKANQFASRGNGIFGDTARQDFMIAVAAAEGKACEIFTLLTDTGNLVAGLVTFRDGGWRRFYTIYFDRAWARYSPGMTLIYEVTAQSLAEGLDCDYMTGEHSYKLRFATSSAPLYRVEASAQQLADLVGQASKPVCRLAAFNS